MDTVDDCTLPVGVYAKFPADSTSVTILGCESPAKPNPNPLIVRRES